jgi:hypothetical protein
MGFAIIKTIKKYLYIYYEKQKRRLIFANIIIQRELGKETWNEQKRRLIFKVVHCKKVYIYIYIYIM